MNDCTYYYAHINISRVCVCVLYVPEITIFSILKHGYNSGSRRNRIIHNNFNGNHIIYT